MGLARINEGRGKQQFEISLKQLLTSINSMMLYKTENTVLVQVSCPLSPLSASCQFMGSDTDNKEIKILLWRTQGY